MGLHTRAHLALIVLAVLALTLVASAGAQPRPGTHGAPLPGNPAAAQPSQTGAISFPRLPVQDTVARTCSIGGHVYRFDSSAVSNTVVFWGYYDGAVYRVGGTRKTDSSGAFTFTNVTGTTQGGLTATFYGSPDSPKGHDTDFGGRTWTSTSADAHLLAAFRIPDSAKAGYGYILGTQRADNASSSLTPRDYIQLAVLKSARAGGGVRLSGIVPTKGHWGAHAGIRKPVLIYARTSKSDAPTKWSPSNQGWHQVAALRCTGRGVFSAVLHPTSRTWYVARYAGDSWYWGAYTNVVTATP